MSLFKAPEKSAAKQTGCTALNGSSTGYAAATVYVFSPWISLMQCFKECVCVCGWQLADKLQWIPLWEPQ